MAMWWTGLIKEGSIEFDLSVFSKLYAKSTAFQVSIKDFLETRN